MPAVPIEVLHDKIVAYGLASPADLVGCSEEDIKQLEDRFGLVLPGFYAAFLWKMGREAGRFRVGSDC
jgi:hypothetical protein